jgi:hypothetical protein
MQGIELDAQGGLDQAQNLLNAVLNRDNTHDPVSFWKLLAIVGYLSRNGAASNRLCRENNYPIPCFHHHDRNRWSSRSAFSLSVKAVC